jgi:hypothetical protein
MKKSILCAVLGILGGTAGGYLAASQTAVPAQLAVVDIQSLIKKSTVNGQTEADAKALTARIKAATAKLVAQGMIVIDSQSVIDAPEEAYVSVE